MNTEAPFLEYVMAAYLVAAGVLGALAFTVLRAYKKVRDESKI